MMNKMKELRELLAIIKGNDWEAAVEAADKIADKHGKKAVEPLIDLLGNNTASIRNAAALALREIADNSAVEPLMQAIQNPINRNNRSTMVYALETMDCSNCFIEIVELALSDKPDVRMAARRIFCEQGFMVDDNDIEKAEALIETWANGTTDVKWKEELELRLNDFR